MSDDELIGHYNTVITAIKLLVAEESSRDELDWKERRALVHLGAQMIDKRNARMRLLNWRKVAA